MPFLSENSGRITYLHVDQLALEESILEQEMPDIVIYEIAERMLYKNILFGSRVQPE